MGSCRGFAVRASALVLGGRGVARGSVGYWRSAVADDRRASMREDISYNNIIDGAEFDRAQTAADASAKGQQIDLLFTIGKALSLITAKYLSSAIQCTIIPAKK